MILINDTKIQILGCVFSQRNKTTCWSEMEKVTKQHMQNVEPEKLAHKICAKNAQNRAK